MINLALLGAWHVHTEGFLHAALATNKCQLTAVWDTNEERGKTLAKKYGVPFIEQLEELLRMEEIHAVMVECETTLHKDVIIKAARAKKHIFTDKILTTTTQEAEEIKMEVEENNVSFFISLESKEIGAYAYAKKLADEGILGDLTSLYFRRAHQAALVPTMLPDYWFDASQTGGGVTLDLGCHGFYLLTHFLGKPNTVTSRMGERMGTGNDEISTTIVEFEGGAIGTAHTSFLSYKLDNMLEIIGTEGILLVSGTPDTTFRMFLQTKNKLGYEELTLVPATQFPEDVMPSAEFVEMLSVGEKEHPLYNMQCALELTRLVESAYESAKSNTTMEIH
ncbi:1,5-anhydro-D-fructose reductase [Bacillus sp. THAF10]|uniref:Gfo/Idh/MocA family protein n=1 Tax=Bacillus sp. THAF10 TaxID=2587848 RepID=UPI0012A7D1FD|nr:Gfo/Idh/MocA family oxidoreductase [Bacillus sp. THAF10]QFT89941.1 1,5-anhydro-D-fructose reductase [Bacillus sp. THAF10]